MLEVPLASFPNSLVGAARRYVWRVRHGCFSSVGLRTRTYLATAEWPSLPETGGNVIALHFHPEDLTERGIANLLRNVEGLREEFDAELVTASEFEEGYRHAA